jgi:hypothetical protein
LLFTLYPFQTEKVQERITEELHEILIMDPLLIESKYLRTYCQLAIFHALDKRFQYKITNAVDINRLLPDHEERSLVRKNLRFLFEKSTIPVDKGVSSVVHAATHLVSFDLIATM